MVGNLLGAIEVGVSMALGFVAYAFGVHYLYAWALGSCPILVLDLWYRLTREDWHLFELEKGGFVMLPGWVLGLVSLFCALVSDR